GFTYMPAEDYHGSDSFSYKANDGQAESSIATVTINVNAATSGALVTGDTCSSSGQTLLVNGSQTHDTVLINPASGSGYQVSLNGHSLGIFSVSRIIVRTYEGDDTVQISGSVNVPLWIFGGSGNDHLNAGNAPSVLIGGSGDDELLGGSARDLLVGGTGADRLVGNADDDILIAAYTEHERNLNALCNIMKEWTRADAGFSSRVAHLEGGASGGLNNSVLLNTSSIHDDGISDQIDVLTGSSGDDWYIFDSANGDRANGVSKTETAVEISDI